MELGEDGEEEGGWASGEVVQSVEGEGTQEDG